MFQYIRKKTLQCSHAREVWYAILKFFIVLLRYIGEEQIRSHCKGDIVKLGFIDIFEIKIAFTNI